MQMTTKCFTLNIIMRMRKLCHEPNVKLYVKDLFITLEGDKMTRYYSTEGDRVRHFVSMPYYPKNPDSYQEWWQVSKKEFNDVEQTFIKVASYFGKYYSFRSDKQVLDVYKI